ncbi:DNA-methyltransferase [Clostridium cellulovorans]|uniref:Methyltransferase n=1 Tax=Clostridium cellulovorans (strain ATCC 35296 / DSM 3052 / OCM 3 / 743B) TaxID=573061 RepID=D9STW1_CLOC7|nr:site-specific DNA-methyltransferase [Clostridium cellulovorans]ADL50799.1 DNA methylase N-4/N-6 domain protein [Clostridium cellulovorans 743B]
MKQDISSLKDKFELKVSSSENLNFILNNSLDLVITSPPYNIGTDYTGSSDDKSLYGYETFIKNVFKECYEKLKMDAYCIVNIPENIKTKNEVWYYPKIYSSILKNIGFSLISVHPWFKLSLDGELFTSKKWEEGKVCKDSHVHSVTEWFMIFKKSNQKEEFKIGEGFTFTPYKTPLHPAAWPVALIEELIKNYCQVEGKVLDPFAGICTTGLACVRNNRCFIGVDISKDYISIGSKLLNEEMLKLKK